MWLSVDYSAATDGLSSKFGLDILEFILSGIPNEEWIRAHKVLGPHNLHYPELVNGKWSKEAVLRGLQSNGQLMGGILSFPILCLANLGVYLAVLDATNGSTSASDLKRVLVNGDDMLYVGTGSHWSLHKVIGKAVGLEMSAGKAYKHRSYANANSTCFVFDLGKAPIQDNGVLEANLVNKSSPFQINFLNAGLVFGQHKVQVRSAGTAESHHASGGCVANIPAILSGCLPGRQSDLLRYVLLTRRSEIRAETQCLVKQGHRQHLVARNLFLPICFGGMGIDPPIDWQYRVKKIDRRIAMTKLQSLLRSNLQLSRSPLQGFPVEDLSEPVPPWIGKVIEPTIPEFDLCHGRLLSIPRETEYPYSPFAGCYLE
jgi:hypothetical protein